MGLPHKIPHSAGDANRAAASSSAPDELTSWKEIAVYLGREMRTVQRWEKTDGLPVRRLKHAKRGSVFAYREELDRWVQSRSQAPSAETVNADKPQPRNLRNWVVIAVTGALVAIIFLSVLIRYSHHSRSAARNAAAAPGQAAYQRGIYYFNRGKIEDLRESEQYFKQALAANAKYAGAQARLAELRLFLRGRSPDPMQEISAALDEANRAVQLDPASAEAHEALATVRALGLWDWSGAEQEFQQALRLNPESGSAHNGYAQLLALVGREDAAIAEAERARQLEPLSAVFGASIPWYHYWARRYDDAIALSRRVLPSEPPSQIAQSCIVRSLVAQGRWEDARLELIAQTRSNGPGNGPDNVKVPLETGLLVAQPKEAVRRYYQWDLAKLEKQEAAGENVNFLIGIDLAALNRKEELLERIKKSLEFRGSLSLVMNLEPLFDPFRSDPRFARMAAETRLPAPPSASRVAQVRGLNLGLASSLRPRL